MPGSNGDPPFVADPNSDDALSAAGQDVPGPYFRRKPRRLSRSYWRRV